MADTFLAVVAGSVLIGAVVWSLSRPSPEQRRLRALRRARDAWSEWQRLVDDDRWQAALDRIDDVEERRSTANELPSQWRWLLANNRAWCLVQLGRGDEAVAQAEMAKGIAPVEEGAYGLGTLGAAYQVAGRSAEAVRLLEEALQVVGDRPESQATRAFFLGEALRALGRSDEARAAYQRAIDESAASKHGRRAKLQLDALSTAPHR